MLHDPLVMALTHIVLVVQGEAPHVYIQDMVNMGMCYRCQHQPVYMLDSPDCSSRTI